MEKEKMKILVTGSKGFIGKNLIRILRKEGKAEEIIEYDLGNSFDELKGFCEKADAVFHLAAVLRPETLAGFDDNIDLTSRLLNDLKETGNKCPVMFASSIQADLDNPYGQCKRTEEGKIIQYGKEQGVHTYVFRFPNLFGTMSRPNYTSVVATFCHNTVKGLPITVNNPAAQMKFAFAETMLERVIRTVLADGAEEANRIITVDEYYTVGLGELAYYMETLKRDTAPAIRRGDDFYDKLKQTYQWYSENADLFTE